MYKVKLYNKISDNGLNCFPKDSFSYSSDLTDYEGILVRSANLDINTISESVLAIARAGAGVNNIPVNECTERGIVVFNTPGANANAVKEMVVAAIYMSSRNVVKAISWVDTIKDKGDDIPKLVEDGKAQFVGPEVSGKSLGVIGLGAVGLLVANAAVNLGLTVYGYDPYLSLENAWKLSPKVKNITDINEIYAVSDYLTIHVPLMNDTKGFINKEALDKAKDGVRVLNFARGELVDSVDMIQAVKSGKVACYITDFPDKYLMGQEGIVNIPHLGASTPESEENCAVMAVQQLSEYLLKGSIINSVNFPRCEAPSSYTSRICFFSNSDVLSAVTDLVRENGYIVENISSVNNRNSSCSYTILDLNSTPQNAFIEQLKTISGIIRIRVIE